MEQRHRRRGHQQGTRLLLVFEIVVVLLLVVHYGMMVVNVVDGQLLSRGFTVDNEVVGEPDIECMDQEIRVWVKTRSPFQGRIYAKGKADDPACARDDFAKARAKKAQFDLGLGMCGMKSLRSYDPRGMYYGITVVVSFHPLFITKGDQAYHVKCFFEEANRGLTAELGVSMIPTTEVEARHGIPGCLYSIHRSTIEDLDAGRPAGTPITFAKVGDKVLHQWHCDDQMYGILINNCYVTDGVNKKADVIDERGCPVDPILITGIRYSADLQRAYAESQVFKFADRPGVWFFCQIQMCMKKHGMCANITPPTCEGSGPGGAGVPVGVLGSGGPSSRTGATAAALSAGHTSKRPVTGKANTSPPPSRGGAGGSRTTGTEDGGGPTEDEAASQSPNQTQTNNSNNTSSSSSSSSSVSSNVNNNNKTGARSQQQQLYDPDGDEATTTTMATTEDDGPAGGGGQQEEEDENNQDHDQQQEVTVEEEVGGRKMSSAGYSRSSASASASSSYNYRGGHGDAKYSQNSKNNHHHHQQQHHHHVVTAGGSSTFDPGSATASSSPAAATGTGNDYDVFAGGGGGASTAAAVSAMLRTASPPAAPAAYGQPPGQRPAAEEDSGLPTTVSGGGGYSGYGGGGGPTGPAADNANDDLRYTTKKLAMEATPSTSSRPPLPTTVVFGPAFSPTDLAGFGIGSGGVTTGQFGRNPPGGSGGASGSSSLYGGGGGGLQPILPAGSIRRRQEVSTEFDAHGLGNTLSSSSSTSVQQQQQRRPPPASTGGGGGARGQPLSLTTATHLPSIVFPTAVTQPPSSPTSTEEEETAAATGDEAEDSVKKDSVAQDSSRPSPPPRGNKANESQTLPPHLSSLLARMEPEAINARNLERLFRDSVADRRALLQGFDLLANKRRTNNNEAADYAAPPQGPPSLPPLAKVVSHRGLPMRQVMPSSSAPQKPGDVLDTVHVVLDSPLPVNRLARDLPLVATLRPFAPMAGESPGNVRPQTKKPPPVDGAVNDHHLMSVSNAANDVAAGRLIAGQLLIYDLDETPPPASPGTTQEDGPVPDDGECGLNRRGLALATALSGGVAAGLLVVTLVLAVRLRQIGGGGGVVGGKVLVGIKTEDGNQCASSHRRQPPANVRSGGFEAQQRQPPSTSYSSSPTAPAGGGSGGRTHRHHQHQPLDEEEDGGRTQLPTTTTTTTTPSSSSNSQRGLLLLLGGVPQAAGGAGDDDVGADGYIREGGGGGQHHQRRGRTTTNWQF